MFEDDGHVLLKFYLQIYHGTFITFVHTFYIPHIVSTFDYPIFYRLSLTNNTRNI